MDLSKLSDQDLAAISANDMSKVSDEGLAHLSEAPQANTMHEKALAMAPGPVAKMGYDAYTSPQGAQQMGLAMLPGASGAVEQGMGRLGRVGMSSLQGGVSNVALHDPDASPADKLKEFLVGGALGGGLGVGSQALGKVGDYLMQKGAGLRKYIPGIGNTLANLGVWGTRSGMQESVPSKLAAEEGKLQDLVKELDGNVSSQTLADAVAAHGKRFQLPSGEIPPNVASEASKVRDTAAGLSQVGGGKLSAEDLLALKRQGDYLGYSASGNPATSLEADLGRAQADASRKGLHLLSEGSETTVPSILKNEQALILANKALQKPETMHQGLGSSLLFGKVPFQNILGTTLGQAADKTGKVLSDPNIRQSLFDLIETK